MNATTVVRDNDFHSFMFVFQERPQTFTEAVQQGLIDKATGTFVDPESKKHIPIASALEMGLLASEPKNIQKVRLGGETKIMGLFIGNSFKNGEN